MNDIKFLALLKRLEWAGEHFSCLECRACKNCGATDHRHDCKLALAIKTLEKRVGK